MNSPKLRAGNVHRVLGANLDPSGFHAFDKLTRAYRAGLAAQRKPSVAERGVTIAVVGYALVVAAQHALRAP